MIAPGAQRAVRDFLKAADAVREALAADDLARFNVAAAALLPVVAALPDMTFFFRADLEVSLNRILDGRPELKYFEAGMDMGFSTDTSESFRIFQGRMLDQYLAMSREFSFNLIDANETVETQQAIVRKLVADRIDLPSYAFKKP